MQPRFRGARWRAGLAAVGLAAAALVAPACARSPELKVASAEVASALDALDDAVDRWVALYRGEVEVARRELGRAVVARTVTARVRALAALDDAGWRARFKARGLIGLSEELEHAEAAAWSLVRQAERLVLADGERAGEALGRLVEAQVQGLRTSAAALRAGGRTEAAEVLEREAATIAAAGADPAAAGHLRALVEMNTLARDLPASVGDLKNAVGALQDMHAEVHRWVMTDQALTAEAVRGAMERAVGGRGLGAPAGGTP